MRCERWLYLHRQQSSVQVQTRVRGKTSLDLLATHLTVFSSPLLIVGIIIYDTDTCTVRPHILRLFTIGTNISVQNIVSNLIVVAGSCCHAMWYDVLSTFSWTIDHVHIRVLVLITVIFSGIFGVENQEYFYYLTTSYLSTSIFLFSHK